MQFLESCRVNKVVPKFTSVKKCKAEQSLSLETIFIRQEINALTIRRTNLTAKFEILFNKIEEFTSFCDNHLMKYMAGHDKMKDAQRKLKECKLSFSLQVREQYTTIQEWYRQRIRVHPE